MTFVFPRQKEDAKSKGGSLTVTNITEGIMKIKLKVQPSYSANGHGHFT